MKKFYIEKLEGKIRRIFDEDIDICDEQIDKAVYDLFPSVLDEMNDRNIETLIYPIGTDINEFMTEIEFLRYENFIMYLSRKEKELKNDYTYVIISKTNDINKEKFFVNVMTSEELVNEFHKKRKFTIKFIDFEKTFEYSLSEVANNPSWKRLSVKFDDYMDNIGISTDVDMLKTILYMG